MGQGRLNGTGKGVQAWAAVALALVSSAALLLFGTGCAGRKVRAGITLEERLKIAKQMFEKGDYLDAKTQFQVIVASAGGTALADEAQFYLAECYFHLKDYVTAVAEYERFVRMYPNSPWVDDAQFKVGVSYYELSPGPGLDQEFTRKAVQALQVFLEDYPASELRPQAEEYLRKCRDKLAEKEFKAGELYRKMGYYESAVIYFDAVLNEYYDTQWAEKALFQKARMLELLGRKEEALEAYQSYLRRHPQSPRVGEARRAVQKLRDELSAASPSAATQANPKR
ncbi:MAG: outer membrane protein assembly factor BamD [candidate division KSB1 bacterium]|nr:outer membrane protein assembly factor BamD [candidate division KSB1 bacterium]